ncbi:MAG: TRAP transporter substrate-binding protein DctP [Rhizobiaceae bacterium]|nr:TRAP transporter substrate-binding protein DctP [Rhizobiaceae bacterium]
MNIMKAVWGSLLAGLATSLMLGPVAAQDPITLKLAHGFSTNHWHWTQGMKVFTEAVEKKTDGKVKFEAYHAGQLGSEVIPLLQSGITDLGLLVPSYEGAKLPLSTVTELPGFHTTPCEGGAQFADLAQEEGALYKNEYEPLGFRPLYVMVVAPYHILTTGKKVSNLEELKGLKIRGNGAAMDKTVRALGAVPVRVTGSESYEALSRGTVDGALWNAQAIRAYNLENTIKYDVVGPQLGAASALFVISNKVWSTLDDATKTTFQEAGALAQQNICDFLTKEDKEITEALVKENGLSQQKLSEDELAKWHSLLAPIAEEWATEMNATGRPGTEILDAFKASASRH